MKSHNRLKLVDRTQYRIPIVKPPSNDKSLPAQGIGLLEFSYDDSYLVCRNGTVSLLRQHAIHPLDLESLYTLSRNCDFFKLLRTNG